MCPASTIPLMRSCGVDWHSEGESCEEDGGGTRLSHRPMDQLQVEQVPDSLPVEEFQQLAAHNLPANCNPYSGSRGL